MKAAVSAREPGAPSSATSCATMATTSRSSAGEREDGAVEDAELVVIAVPSRSFSEVVHDLPGTSPVLSLTKGLDPSTGGRLTALVPAPAIC
jgi:glycerol-3-phosphate dehydrogenase